MTWWPVVVREIRAEARHGGNYWQRVAAGAGLIAIFWIVAVQSWFEPARSGALLFGNLNSLLLVSLALGANLMVADCLSWEKRERTLGLLFLTPLTAEAIVLGKCVAQFARVLVLWLVAAPIMFLPLLMGGVEAWQAAMAVGFHFNAILWSLSAGLVASARSERMHRAYGAALLAWVLVIGLATGLLGLHFCVAFVPGIFPGAGLGNNVPWWGFPLIGCGIMSNVAGIWSEFASRIPAGVVGRWMAHMAVMTAMSAGVLWLAIGWAARCLRRGWRVRPLSLRQERWQRTFCGLRFAVGWFRRWRARVLERNPVAWLQGYTWSARLAPAVWLVLVMIVLGVPLLEVQGWRISDLPEAVLTAAILLAPGLAFTAASSFRQEIRSGVLALLVISPVHEWRILCGRVRGIARQFVPAAGLLVFTSVCVPWWGVFGSWANDLFRVLVAVGVSYGAVVLVGLYFALCGWRVPTAWLATLIASYLPYLLTLIAMGVIEYYNWHGSALSRFVDDESAFLTVMGLCQWSIALLAFHGARRRLQRRQFPSPAIAG